jgi:predicted YcjX-like family ATPase
MLPASQLVSRALDGDRRARRVVTAMSVAGATAFVLAEMLLAH